MYRHWHDEQDAFTKIVLTTEAATTKTAKKEKQSEPA